ncbi:MAG: methyltransferase [Candidatus Marinimicrobia bacterium]|nr:methyltransferase [Candidatus Neomarinimicrobiota bacterium]|tara:strand:- start:6558 stop:7079 length:522 start_codon:yes stop_codon:yes gene_type:complete
MGDLSILAGAYKGTRISSPVSKEIRPTLARVRKSLFDILGDLSGCSVLDLFAGTGALGFEAASRGASSITFLEMDKKLSDSIQKNSLLFHETDIQVKTEDAFRFLERSENQFALILADPPYGAIDLDLLLGSARKKVKGGGRLVVESAVREEWRPSESKIRTYGDTQLSFIDL